MVAKKELKKKYEALLTTLGKRPKAVLEKILENGSVSTYELGELGYDQPPRAAQDLKEHGVRLTVTYGKHPETGSRMAIYALATQEDIENGFAGRRAFPPKFRAEVLEKFEDRCNLCNAVHPSTNLQLDHRIPYIVVGEPDDLRVEEFQPLCGSHQRKKSWECEHCPNRNERKPEVCRTCFWAFPESDFKHVATRDIRQLDVVFRGKAEVTIFDKFRELSKSQRKHPADLAKKLMDEFTKTKK